MSIEGRRTNVVDDHNKTHIRALFHSRPTRMAAFVGLCSLEVEVFKSSGSFNSRTHPSGFQARSVHMTNNGKAIRFSFNSNLLRTKHDGNSSYVA